MIISVKVVSLQIYSNDKSESGFWLDNEDRSTLFFYQQRIALTNFLHFKICLKNKPQQHGSQSAKLEGLKFIF